MKYAAMNIIVHLFESLLSLLLGTWPDVELLGHIVILCLSFFRNHHIVFYNFKNWNIIVLQCCVDF